MDVHTALAISDGRRRQIISDMRRLKVHSAPQRHVYLKAQMGHFVAHLRASRPGIRVTRPMPVR